MALYTTSCLILARYVYEHTLTHIRTTVLCALQDGKPELVQAASVSIHGNHGQHIENIHLETYDTEEDFWARLYDQKYSRLFEKAEAFMKGSSKEKILVFIR